MNSLDFINNQIEFQKLCIKNLKEEKLVFPPQLNLHYDFLEKYEQIKKDLERNEYFERPKIARYLNYETGRVQCPTCEYKIPIRKNKILNNINYCPRCGQRLVFSEIELEEVEELENG